MAGVKYNPTPEDLADMEAWLLERPAAIVAMVRSWPPWHCYRMADSHGHYTIYSYAENETVTLTHGDDSTLPGVQVFGIDPHQLSVCDCGKWEFPTAPNIARTKKRVDAAIAKRHPTRKGVN